MRDMTGRRIMVTGSSGGFGRATVELLERRGACVVGVDVAPGRDDEVACDITDPQSAATAVAVAIKRLGGLDVLVNNAGIGTAGPIAQLPGATDRRVFEVNALGAWTMTSSALPHLLDTRGHVVNVASLLAFVALPQVAAYSASKRALCAMSDVLRIEHAEHGLAVTTIYPGYVPTAIHEDPERRTGLSLRGRVPEERVEQVARAIFRAIERRPRDAATSRGGALALRVARTWPSLADRLVRAQLRRHPITPAADARLHRDAAGA